MRGGETWFLHETAPISDFPSGKSHSLACPLGELTSFELKTATDVYADGDPQLRPGPNEIVVRDPLVLCASKNPGTTGHVMMPLTYTSAPWVQVAELHGQLLQKFLVERGAVMARAREVAPLVAEDLHLQQNEQRNAKYWENEKRVPALKLNGWRFAGIQEFGDRLGGCRC